MDTKQPKDGMPGGRLMQSRAEAKTARRADALFRALATDYLLREQFTTDPAQLLSEYLGGQELTKDESDAANQLIFAVVSNPRLRDWMVDYARALNGRTPSRHEFALAFAKANAAHGDDLTTLALIRGSADSQSHFAIQADLMRALLGVVGGSSAATDTEADPDTASTMSSSAAHVPVTAGGDTMQWAGDERSLGHPDVSRLPAHLNVTLGALVQYANQLRARGALLSSGLEDH